MIYEELVKRLRRCGQFRCRECEYEKINGCRAKLNKEAADAIEELQTYAEWIPIESRPMDNEEYQYYKEHFDYDYPKEEAIIYCCKLPDDGEEVLVCSECGFIWKDTFSNDQYYGVGFEENGDMDGIVAWMPLPKPYKPPKEETC